MKKTLFTALLLISGHLQGTIIYEGEPSDNFIIRWAFQDLCDHHYDPRSVWPTPSKDGRPVSFKASHVQPGDMVFVRDLTYYFHEKHKKIKVPYFILTHGEYLDKFKEKFLHYLNDDKILALFTIHPSEIEHERVIPIPLGVVQYKHLYDKRKKVQANFMKYRTQSKDKLVYMNFTDWHMPWRTKIKNYFEKKSFVTHHVRCNFKEYITELAQHKFVISPPGLGPDCYRVWESCLAGTIPIVQHSHMDKMYEGLPVLLIDNWKEVTEEFLYEKYKEMTAKTYSQEKLYMEYWIDLIQKTRKKLWPH